jgi:hypothetical protein
MGLAILLLPAVMVFIAIRAWHRRKGAPVSAGLSVAATGGALTPWPAGDPRTEYIFYEFAIYYLPKPARDPLAELDRLLGEGFRMFVRTEKLVPQPVGMTVAARLVGDPKSSYAPPGLGQLNYFGRGLNRQQAEALQDAGAALVLEFGYPKEHGIAGMRAALELSLALARATEGVLWDEETRETFTPDAWEERRLADWADNIPVVSGGHIFIRCCNEGNPLRCVTLGMAKFGLPDLVIEGFSWAQHEPLAHVINLLSQALVEGAPVARPGEFDLDVRVIRHAVVRQAYLQVVRPRPAPVLTLGLFVAAHQEADPRNRLIRIAPEKSAASGGISLQEKTSGAFGRTRSVTPAEHDEELLAASRSARDGLPALKAAFDKGLAPREFVRLKAPFKVPGGGHEYMWVQATSWVGDKIRGLLINEPVRIPDLHGGQTVEVSEADVFDWLHLMPDGTWEGNTTGELVNRRARHISN